MGTSINSFCVKQHLIITSCLPCIKKKTTPAMILSELVTNDYKLDLFRA